MTRLHHRRPALACLLAAACTVGPHEGPQLSTTDPGTDDGSSGAAADDAGTSDGSLADTTGPAGDDAPSDDTGPEGDDDSGVKLDVGDIPPGRGGGDCSDMIVARIRDLDTDFPDIAMISDPDNTVAKTGLVESHLDDDSNPVFASQGPGPQLTSAASFAQWYEDVAGVNIPFDVPLVLVDHGTSFVYDSNMFFPIDGMGYGNVALDHNFYFTTEIQMLFVYEPGQVFTFTGDDDFWLFIEGELVIDLGGLHSALSETIVLDDWAGPLGLQAGGTHSMAIFHAERGLFNSNFRIETTIGCIMPEG